MVIRTTWSKNDIRNNFHVNAVLMPHRSYQIQAGYFRKFRNPSVTALFSEPWSDQTNVLKGGNPLLEEIHMDQYKVACTYTGHIMIASIGVATTILRGVRLLDYR